jgi:hypothetical protein
MWSSEALPRRLLLALILASAATLAGCSGLTPVYGDHGIASERQAFRYARPATRLDQVIIEELKLRLGESRDAGAPLLTVVSKTETRDLTRSKVARADEQHEAVVTAALTITDASGATLLQTSRSAAASFTTDGQGLADTEAERSAGEQAAKSLAETLRLTVLGSLATR